VATDSGELNMAMDGTADAIAFGVAADLVYNVFSATNSSPQTTELFAGDRAATLMKYVRLGGLQSAILVGIMAVRGRSVWPIIGGGLAGAMMWMMYNHALAAGQNKPPPKGAV
jgi:hypothetical protein